MTVLRHMRPASVLTLLAALSACDAAADKQRQEEAIARGEPPAAGRTASDPAQVACARAHGKWSLGHDRCELTREMCEGASAGTWREGIGCTLAVESAADCVGFGGVRWAQDACVLDWLDRNEVLQNGL